MLGNYNHTACTNSDIHGHLIEEVCFHSSQDTTADLDLTLEAHIVTDLQEDEYFNFSVRLHAS